MKGSLLLYSLKLNCLIFSTSLNSLLIIFIQTYTVNYRNALDRLRVRMNIILCIFNSLVYNNSVTDTKRCDSFFATFFRSLSSTTTLINYVIKTGSRVPK